MKTRNRVIYANEGIFAGPAFQNGVVYTENIYTPNLSKVQSISYGININKQEYNVLGKSFPASRQYSSHPEVTLDIVYNSASATNEKLLGLSYDSTDNSFIKNIIDETDVENYRKNFYVVSSKEGTDFVSGDPANIENVLFFSDCMLKSYTYDIAVKSLPEVSVSFAGDNMGYFQAPKKSEDVVIYTSDFSSDVDGWSANIGATAAIAADYNGKTNVLKSNGTTTDIAHQTYRQYMFTVGKKYKVAGKFYIDTAGGTYKGLSFYTGPQTNYDGMKFHSILASSTWTPIDLATWVDFEYEFTATAVNIYVFPTNAAGGSVFAATTADNFAIKDIVVTEIPPDPINIYTSDFSAGNDGWTASSTSHFENHYPADGANPPVSSLHVRADTATSTHYTQRNIFTVGKKYKVSGKIYIPDYNPILDAVHVHDGYGVILHTVTTKSEWVSFDLEFTAVSELLVFYGLTSSLSYNWASAGVTPYDDFWIADIVVTAIPFQDHLKIPILNKKTAFEESHVEVAIPQGQKVDEQVLVPSEASISITKSSDSAESNSPDKIRGLSMWLDADALDFNNGDTVDEWKDKTGNVTFVTDGAANNTPEYLVDYIPGHDWVYFGAAESMVSSSTLGDIISNKGYTVFILYLHRAGNVPVGTSCSSGGITFGSDTWGHRVRYNGQNTEETFYTADSNSCPVLNTTVSNVNLAIATFDSAKSKMRVRKVGPLSVDSGSTDNNWEIPVSEITDLTSTLKLGVDSFDGDIAEILVYRRNLAESEKYDVQKYLYDKYGFWDWAWDTANGETRPLDFKTKTGIIDFKNDKLQSINFDLKLERRSEDIIGHKIPLDKTMKFPIKVESNLSFLVDNSEEESLSTLLSNDEKYNILTSFIRNEEKLNIYSSSFDDTEDGWAAQGGTLVGYDYDDPNTPNEPDDYLQFQASDGASYHEAFRPMQTVVGKKYLLTGDVWLSVSSPNFEKIAIMDGEVVLTEISMGPQWWQSFSVNYVATSDFIRVRGLDSGGNGIFEANHDHVNDVFYIQDFKLYDTERKKEIVNISLKNAELTGMNTNLSIGENKKVNITVQTYIDKNGQETGLGFSGIYTSPSV